MAGRDDLEVALVPPRLWTPLVEQAFAPLAARGARQRRLAETILWTFHNRHVGITPELVAYLVPVLVDPRAAVIPANPRGWGLVLRRLAREITPPSRDGVSTSRYHGVVPATSISYSVLRLVLPLVLRACRLIRKNFLFAGDEAGTTVTPQAYGVYAQALADTILKLAEAPPVRDDATGETEREPFWYEPAAGLSGMVSGSAEATRSYALPVADPIELALLLRLRPKIPSDAWAHRRRLSMPTSPTRGRRRREEGYVGIHLTHRDDDLPAMLLSEWMMPELLRLERLLNTGFMALERRPRRQRIRDVLIIALMPPSLRERVGSDLLKAAWVDCQLRLTMLLRQNRLLKSEIRWIEGDTLDRYRVCSFQLEDLPSTDAMDAPALSQGRREGLLSAMRWLPAYVDERAHYRGGPRPGSPPPPDPQQAPAAAPAGANGRPARLDLAAQLVNSAIPEWVYATWQAHQAEARRTSGNGHRPMRASHQTRDERRRQARRQAEGVAPVDSFAFVHVMAFLPAEDRPLGATEWERGASAVLSTLRTRLGMGSRPDRHLSVTWVPDDLSTPSQWVVDARRRSWQAAPDDAAPLDEDELAGWLVTTWLTEITEELSGG